MDESPTILILDSGQRRPGRPRVDEPRTSVSTWIPASYHDRLIKMANARDQSVSRTLADILRQALRNTR